MIIPILIIVLAAASFVAGALYGRQAEARAIAYDIRVVAAYHKDVSAIVSILRSRVASLKAHL